MKSKSYSELLKDPRWQKKRLEVLERDGFKCQWCLSGEDELHVHHSFYDWKLKPWEYQMRYLHTLCSDCHEAAETALKMVRSVIGNDPIAFNVIRQAVISIMNGKHLEAYVALHSINSGFDARTTTSKP